MKRIFVLLIFSLLLFVPSGVFAAGGLSVSTTNLTVEKGKTATFTITANNAAGKVDVISSGSAISAISISDWLDNSSLTVTVKGLVSGTAQIYINPSDMTTYDEETVTNKYIVTVRVTNPVTPAPTPSTPTTPTTPTNPTTPTKPSTPADTRSGNANIASLSVNGKQLTNTDNIYSLEVANHVTSANIEVTLEHDKATVTGDGKKELAIGDNSFVVTVTAENGSAVNYTVKINRKSYNTFSDFDNVIKNDKDSEIRIEDNDKLSKEKIDKVINEKGKVTLTKVSNDNKQLYSWVIDGKTVKNNGEFDPNLPTAIKEIDNIEKAFNYADGIYFDLSNCNNIPDGIVLRYYVGDKYSDGDNVNVYTYSSDGKIVTLKSGIAVKDGYVEIDVKDTNTHFISMSKLDNSVPVASKSEFNVWLIVAGVLAVIVVVLVIIIVSKNKNNSSKTYGASTEIKEAKKEANGIEVKQSNVLSDSNVGVSPIKEPKKLEASVKPEPIPQIDVVNKASTPVAGKPVDVAKKIDVAGNSEKPAVPKAGSVPNAGVKPVPGSVPPKSGTVASVQSAQKISVPVGVSVANSKESVAKPVDSKPLAPVIDKNAQNVPASGTSQKNVAPVVAKQPGTAPVQQNVSAAVPVVQKTVAAPGNVVNKTVAPTVASAQSSNALVGQNLKPVTPVQQTVVAKTVPANAQPVAGVVPTPAVAHNGSVAQNSGPAVKLQEKQNSGVVSNPTVVQNPVGGDAPKVVEQPKNQNVVSTDVQTSVDKPIIKLEPGVIVVDSTKK